MLLFLVCFTYATQHLYLAHSLGVLWFFPLLFNEDYSATTSYLSPWFVYAIHLQTTFLLITSGHKSPCTNDLERPGVQKRVKRWRLIRGSTFLSLSGISSQDHLFTPFLPPLKFKRGSRVTLTILRHLIELPATHDGGVWFRDAKNAINRRVTPRRYHQAQGVECNFDGGQSRGSYEGIFYLFVWICVCHSLVTRLLCEKNVIVVDMLML